MLCQACTASIFSSCFVLSKWNPFQLDSGQGSDLASQANLNFWLNVWSEQLWCFCTLRPSADTSSKSRPVPVAAIHSQAIKLPPFFLQVFLFQSLLYRLIPVSSIQRTFSILYRFYMSFLASSNLAVLFSRLTSCLHHAVNSLWLCWCPLLFKVVFDTSAYLQESEVVLFES